MVSFSPPKTKYTNIRDIGRFNLVWNINTILAPIFLVLFVLMLSFKNPSYITALVAFLMSSLNLLVLFFSRKYTFVTIYSLILSTLIIQLLIFVVDESRLIPSVLWITMLSIFAFYMLGRIAGQSMLLINIVGVLFYLTFGNLDKILAQGLDLNDVNFGLVVDVGYVTFALLFIMHKLLATTETTYGLYEEQIEKNEVLLKEIHHRVKNNLQIILSLLKLQSNESENVQLREEFGEAIGRIRSMALIHEKMYQNKDLSSVNIAEYLKSLGSDIIRSFNVNHEIEFQVKSDIESIDIKSMVPISLIFNELITNSVKHGLKSSDQGSIDIAITSVDEYIDVNYFDDGKWLEPRNEKTFGLELISILTKQLDAEYSRNTKNGTNYHFRFNEKKFLFNSEE